MSALDDPEAPLLGLSSRQMAFYRFRSNPLALIGAFIVLSVALAAIFAPILAPSPARPNRWPSPFWIMRAMLWYRARSPSARPRSKIEPRRDRAGASPSASADGCGEARKEPGDGGCNQAHVFV